MKKQNKEFKKIDSKLKEKAKCNICYGYGLWTVGDPSPMGPMDYADGCPSKKCPECGKGGK
jgi:hypothetical protein